MTKKLHFILESATLFSYNVSGAVFVDEADGLTELKLFATHPTDSLDFKIYVGENNPDSSYSCLGSMNYADNSFGDCAYTDNRVWVYLGILGDDITSPITSYIPPFYFGHSTQIKLKITDDRGGSITTYYCVEDDEESLCDEANVKVYKGSAIKITCEDSFACTKYLKYWSVDEEGNDESEKADFPNDNIYTAVLLAQGNSCKSDCTGQPSPNRFVSSCNQVNGCIFKPLQGEGRVAGETIAGRCNFYARGSFVNYNGSHQVMCPNGKFRKNPKELNIVVSGCPSIITRKYPVIYEGRQILLNVHVCFK